MFYNDKNVRHSSLKQSITMYSNQIIVASFNFVDINVLLDKPIVKFSLTFELVVLILNHSFSYYTCLSWSTAFRGFGMPTENAKIGIQRK